MNGVIQDPSGPALLVSALPFANIDTDGVIYLCKDPRARNYTLANIGQHSAEVCTFDTDLVVGITITPSPRCEQGFTLTEDLSKGLSDGVLHKGKIVSQVAQLQLHINRLLNQYELPAGLVDGVFGVHTQRGVELLQGFLNDVIYPSPQLAIDGIVGKNTRTAINASCPAVEV